VTIQLQLRPVEDNDRWLLFDWRNQERILEVSTNSGLISRDTHAAWFENVLREDQPKTMICLFNSRPVGVIQIEKWDSTQKSGMWGCYLGESDTSPVVGAALPYLALAHAFEDLSARKMQAVVLSSNRNMLQIHKRLGIREEGRFVKQILHGEIELDQVLFGVHKNEWLELSEKILRFFPNSIKDQLRPPL
jgi:UDP-4-amino-4,6-dideoxy-N-acetyl-beta-L-altrosamine N-acetyltransferase